MSDGPHLSLPLRRPWPKLAERAAKLAYSVDEMVEALEAGLRRELREVPPVIREIMGGGEQAALFDEDRIAQLEAARSAAWGSTLATAVINCAIEATQCGRFGDEGFSNATETALREVALGHFRSMEEHYLGKAGLRSASNLRTRLDACLKATNLTALVRKHMTSTANKSPNPLPVIRTGIDEGPRL